MLDTVTVLKKANKFDEAYAVLEQARTVMSGQKGENDSEVQGLVVGLADIRIKQKKPEEAIPLFESALKVLHDIGSPQEVQLLHLMISVQESQKNTDTVNKLKALLKTAITKHNSS
jgi:tetratricopeptide (TPR) repeat protein